MVEHNFLKGVTVFHDYVILRIRHLFSMGFVNFVRHISYLIKFVIVIFYDYTTKMSSTNPIITAVLPTVYTPPILLFQLIFNIFTNKWWAHGNLFLIFMQLFTEFQAFWMMLLVWDVPLYLYTLRIWRYFIFGLALAFSSTYILMIGIDLNLLFMVDEWESNQKVFNGFMLTLLSYMAFNFFPTFVVNCLII